MIRVDHVINTRSDFMCYTQSKLGELDLVKPIRKPELVAVLHERYPDAFANDPDAYDLNNQIDRIGMYILTLVKNRTKSKIWVVQDPLHKRVGDRK